MPEEEIPTYSMLGVSVWHATEGQTLTIGDMEYTAEAIIKPGDAVVVNPKTGKVRPWASQAVVDRGRESEPFRITPPSPSLIFVSGENALYLDTDEANLSRLPDRELAILSAFLNLAWSKIAKEKRRRRKEGSEK